LNTGCKSSVAANRITDLGSSLVEAVEDDHPQDEHYHLQHEDGTVEDSIFRMPGSFPKTIVSHRVSYYHQKTPW
jgi:hypothetical protein